MKKNVVYGKILKIILWVYIILCILIAGLNYGYAPRADAATARFLTWFWHFYENWIKTAFIIIASILTLAISKSAGRAKLRTRNMLGTLGFSKPTTRTGRVPVIVTIGPRLCVQ